MNRHTFIRTALAATTLAALAACSHMGMSGSGAAATGLTETYTAKLSPGDEVPPAANSKGSGTFEMHVNLTNNEFTWKLSSTGLTGDATAAHIHGPAAKGSNAGVVVPLPGGEGKGKLTQAQYGDLAAGLYYVNVHSKQYPNGEIRGQLVRK